MASSTYDKLRWFTEYFLPGAATLYFTLAAIWGLPFAEPVVGTIVAFTVFLNLILGLSKAQYKDSEESYDGVLSVEESENKDVWTFEATKPLEELVVKDEVVFKVRPQ